MSTSNDRWLIVLGLDGTLFGDDLVISPRVRRTIAAAQAAALLQKLTAGLGPSAAVVRSQALFVEVTHPEVSTGRALLALAERVEISRRRILAIGDNHNDLPLIEAAGIGVAMGNATATVKERADWVAPPVEEDGAAVAIERFVLDAVDGR